MRWGIATIVILAALTAVGGIGYWFGHRSSSAPAAPEAAAQPDEPTAVPMVRTMPLTQQKLTRNIVAYGTVIAQPSDVSVVSVPFEARVRRVLIAPGQRVTKGDDLVEVTPSADTQLQMRIAQAALEGAKKDFAQTQARFNDRLATNQDLLLAQQTMDQAQLKLDAYHQNGVAAEMRIKSEAGGLVSKVDVQDGQLVPIGAALVEVVPENRIEVRLAVEPDDARKLQKNQPVELSQVHDDNAAARQGAVALVTERVNPDTRLVDVFVSLPKDAGMMLDGFVSAKIAIDSREGFVLPRNAVLKDDDQFVLYTVRDDKAVKHSVKIDLETDQQVLITSDDLKAGELAVVVGNYELKKGMAVTSMPADTPATQETEPPDTVPATRESPATEASH